MVCNCPNIFFEKQILFIEFIDVVYQVLLLLIEIYLHLYGLQKVYLYLDKKVKFL